MIVAKHVTPDKRMVLAVCDSDLIGRRLEEGKLQLDLSSGFYRGDEMDRTAISKLLGKAYIINCVGKESVGLALDSKLCTEDCVMHVRNVPHCQAINE